MLKVPTTVLTKISTLLHQPGIVDAIMRPQITQPKRV